MKVSLIIPTLNAEKFLKKLLFNASALQNLKPDEIIVVDSSSEDRTVEIAKDFGCKVFSIPREKFNHGGTRTFAGKKAKGDILIYLTQDALPYDADSFKNLVNFLISDENLAGVYGRQIPYPDADILAKFFRYLNYPEKSFIREYKDKEIWGRKTVFFSNSFSAYKKDLLEKIGWFKDNLIAYEDIYIAGKFLLNGYKIGYCAEAKVIHSHKISFKKEFERHFKLGMFFREENWIIKAFGKKPKKEGIYMIKEYINFAKKEKNLKSVFKFLALVYLRKLAWFLGYHYKYLPDFLVSKK